MLNRLQDVFRALTWRTSASSRPWSRPAKRRPPRPTKHHRNLVDLPGVQGHHF